MKRHALFAIAIAALGCSASEPEPLASLAEPLVVLPSEGGTVTGSTSGTSQYAGTCAQTNNSPEQVYQWTAPRSGMATITTCGGTTNFDTVVYVRQNTINGQQPTNWCNDDAVPACAADASKLTFTAVACATYFIFHAHTVSSHSRG